VNAAPIYATVRNGPYAGFTVTEMETELARYKEKLKTSGTTLRGASMGGKSYQIGPRVDWSLPEWSRQIRYALSQVSPDFAAPSHTHVVQFGCV
jgi:hypothetical protein